MLLANTVADAIRTRDHDKFMTFLDRACGSITTDPVDTFTSLKELLVKATAAVNIKLQKAVNERAVNEMKKASSSSSSSQYEGIMAIDGEVPIKLDPASSTKYDIENSQFLEPRGRFNVSISDSGILLQGKQSVFLPWSKISNLARVPSHTSTKKEGEDIIAIRLADSGVKFNNKDLKSFLWVLDNVVVNDSTQADVVTMHLQTLGKKKIGRVNKALFQSIMTQKCFLRCYNGIQEGGLYPLKCGILFIKPLVFIPTEEIGTVVAGRGGGTGNTRYVDLQIETTDDRVIEFTNIDREELPSLQNYVKNYLEVRAKQRAAATQAEAVSNCDTRTDGRVSGVAHLLDIDDDDEDDDDDDEDDEDFDPDADDSDDARSGSDSGSESDGDSDASDDDASGSDIDHASRRPSKPAMKASSKAVKVSQSPVQRKSSVPASGVKRGSGSRATGGEVKRVKKEQRDSKEIVYVDGGLPPTAARSQPTEFIVEVDDDESPAKKKETTINIIE